MQFYLHHRIVIPRFIVDGIFPVDTAVGGIGQTLIKAALQVTAPHHTLYILHERIHIPAAHPHMLQNTVLIKIQLNIIGIVIIQINTLLLRAEIVQRTLGIRECPSALPVHNFIVDLLL